MKGKRIVIDTNVLYSWVGISPNDKLPSSKIDKLAEKNELYVTTATVIEAIVKHRDNLDEIKKCLKPIMERKAIPVSIGFTPIPNETMIKLYNANSIAEVTTEIDEVFRLKIEQESWFLRFLFILFIYGFFYILSQNGKYKYDDKEKAKQFGVSIVALILGNAEFTLDVVKRDLTDGYSRNDEQKTIKKSFSSLFESLLRVWLMSYYMIKNSYNIIEAKFPDEGNIEAFKKDIIDDNMLKNIDKLIENPVKFIKRADSLIKKYFDDLSDSLGRLNHITPEVMDYILFQMEKIFKTNAKINKNDVMDLLQVYSLSISGFTILTLDRKFNNVLEKASKKSHAIAKSLGIVKKDTSKK